jgi:hypothetical protein
LGESKDPRAVEPLISALKDTDLVVRKGATYALGHLGKPAVELLIAGLDNENALVREGAAIALGYIEDPRAVESLNAALKDPILEVRESAARALGKIKDAPKGATYGQEGTAVSSDEIQYMITEIYDRIAPFHLKDARNGFKDEMSSKNNKLKSSFGVGDTTVVTIERVRPSAGNTSVEISTKNGRLDTLSFKNLTENGFEAIWAAKPTVVLSSPIDPDASSGVGFNRVILLSAGVATVYTIVGTNSWSKATQPYH